MFGETPRPDSNHVYKPFGGRTLERLAFNFFRFVELKHTTEAACLERDEKPVSVGMLVFQEGQPISLGSLADAPRTGTVPRTPYAAYSVRT